MSSVKIFCHIIFCWNDLHIVDVQTDVPVLHGGGLSLQSMFERWVAIAAGAVRPYE